MDELWTIFGFVLAGGILAFESMYWLIFQLRDRKRALNRRLDLASQDSSKVQVYETLLNERGLSGIGAAAPIGLSDFLVQTGLKMTKSALAIRTVLVGAILAVGASFVAPQLWMAIVAGVAGAPLLVAIYLSTVRKRRIERFSMQLPDALGVIVRGLRVGYPFTSAAELVSREMPDPIGTEFGLTADEIAFGQDISSAVEHLYRRVGQPDLLFLTIAVSVQSQTGGNLADVLARLSTLMRDRVKLRLKVKALSAEGRLSAWVLTAMPILLILALHFISPNYFTIVFESKALTPALIYIGTSIGLSNVAISKMVNFKV